MSGDEDALSIKGYRQRAADIRAKAETREPRDRGGFSRHSAHVGSSGDPVSSILRYPLPALERGGFTVQPRDCGSDLIRGVNQSSVQMDIALSYASNGVTVAGLQQMTIEERNRGINLADVG